MTIKNNFVILITRWLTLCASGKPLVLTIHKKASQCNCTQWVKTHCYSGYEFSYALKNNFEILINKGFALRPFGKPLVLTSINFDSLSRKIKNPCLVIKKFKSIKEIFKMKILKTKKLFTYMVVGALSLALSISCKSNEEPTDNTHSNHPPAGTYQMVYGSSLTITATVTVSGGACNIKGTAYKNGDTSGSDNKQYDITITKWYAEAGSTDSGNVFVGGEYPSGEATVAAPTGYTSFTVQYYNGNTIRVGFRVDGTWYSTYDMVRQ